MNQEKPRDIARIKSKRELLDRLRRIPHPYTQSLMHDIQATDCSVWPDNHLEDE